MENERPRADLGCGASFLIWIYGLSKGSCVGLGVGRVAVIGCTFIRGVLGEVLGGLGEGGGDGVVRSEAVVILEYVRVWSRSNAGSCWVEIVQS